MLQVKKKEAKKKQTLITFKVLKTKNVLWKFVFNIKLKLTCFGRNFINKKLAWIFEYLWTFKPI